MKLIFIGMNHEYSLTPLRALAERFEVVGVVESLNPRSPSPHGSWLARIARRRSIPCFSMDRDHHPLEFFRRLEADLICVAGMLQLLRPEEWSASRLGAINLHPSLLPNYRGPDPFFWQAQRMELDTGVTVFQIDEGVDTGDILLQDRLTIPVGEPHEQLVQRTAQAGAGVLVRCVEGLTSGSIQPRPQRHLPCPFPARLHTSDDYAIDWQAWPIERIWHFLRAAPTRNPTIPTPLGNDTWRIGNMVRGATSQPPGSLGNDDQGYFLSHIQGNIRLERVRKPSLARRFLQRLRRDLSPP